MAVDTTLVAVDTTGISVDTEQLEVDTSAVAASSSAQSAGNNTTATKAPPSVKPVVTYLAEERQLSAALFLQREDR